MLIILTFIFLSKQVKTKIANFQEVTINHLMSHIAAQKAFMNMKHPDLKHILNKEENPAQWEILHFFNNSTPELKNFFLAMF